MSHTPLLTHRRAVLKGGALGLIPALSSAPAWAAIAPGVLIDAHVIDRRVWPGALPRSDAPVLPFDGDITALWYHRLDPRWRRPGFVLGGITGADTLFVLEQLARTRHRAVVSRRPLSAGATQWVIAPAHPSIAG
ncbi:hypothetical protein GTZ99_03635 [Novosphingobium sp. FSY-8]|uniref:Secreted protein n=1 Tax=Novosphingobium ovatum TaxID=1908523 RepID=A0ABW9XAT2_9SPHN|nr:hypothetical protein [Novosphingobium ovatum]NBC35644.1 hypothetical protein [Novosphingobium ovatum]